ncbi:MAG TPA: TatD family hydrolase [Solirubrobacteraceae bacterium]|nr:TatD family hydrolase [Solirubrobacteraceae bacterium]
MIDSHTHLDLCAGTDLSSQAQLVGEAVAAGVSRLLTVGIDPASCRAALAAAEAFPQVYAAIGRHPNEARGFDRSDLAELRALASHERCLAIGESGIDLYREGAPLADQERAFCAQIDLAGELGKPLVIHTRAATERTLELLNARAQGVTVILHCFSMPEQLESCLQAGWWISFAGNVTYPSAHALAAALELVPGERLLLETDAPYLAPQTKRGERNRPSYVVHTARFAAQRRGVELEQLSALLDDNWRALFGEER